MDLSEKVAIVTGSSRGIGRGIAECLAAAGAKVILHASEEENLRDCIEYMNTCGYQTAWVCGDIAEPETAQRLVGRAIELWNRLDIIVNCAGMNWDGMLHRMTDEQWKRVVDVDLNGAFYLMSRAAKIMRQNHFGRIINISSAAWKGNFGQSNYSAAKAGLVALTKTAALELGAFHITCNAITPGVIETDMIRKLPRETVEKFMSRIPAGRMGIPADVGNMIVFLCSDSADYINGEVIGVGGGFIL